jgi:hypothetical protein
LKWKCESERAKAGAKSERAEQELEGKLPPFSWFFLGRFLVYFVISVLQKRRRRWQCAIVFLCGAIVAKKVLPSPSSQVVLKRKQQRQLITIALFFCVREEKDDSNAPSSLLW